MTDTENDFPRCCIDRLGKFPRASSNGLMALRAMTATAMRAAVAVVLASPCDQQVVFSVARITGVAYLPTKVVV